MFMYNSLFALLQRVRKVRLSIYSHVLYDMIYVRLLDTIYKLIIEAKWKISPQIRISQISRVIRKSRCSRRK